MKKGLVTLVCLTMMSAVWSWAATTFLVQIKTTNPGGYVALLGAKADTTAITSNGITTYVGSTKYASTVVDASALASDAEIGTAEIKADATHKIASITKNGVAQGLGDGTIANVTLTKADFVDPTKVSGFKNPTVIATFADKFAGEAKSWQLQVRNNNVGGTISTKRATDAAAAVTTTIGNLVLKNYKDTSLVTVTVVPKEGFHIAKITLNGKEQVLAANGATTVVTVNPASSTSKVFTVAATYKQNALVVTNSVALAADGHTVAAKDYSTAFGGTVMTMVVPPAENNLVTAISVVKTGTEVVGKATFTAIDSLGKTSAPFRGAVKVVISGIQESVTVKATFATDPKTAIYQECSATCHASNSSKVASVYGTWDASKHSTNGVDCAVCHSPNGTWVQTAATPTAPAVPFNMGVLRNLSTAVRQQALCVTCHNATSTASAKDEEWRNGAHGTASGHTTGTCQRCHATEGSIVGATYGWTGSYATLTANQAKAWTPNAKTSTNGVQCAACHDPHGGLRQINTSVDGSVIAWDPNANGSSNDQYDVCTSCHTLQDGAGALVGNYHDGGSINVTRTISDSHFDNKGTTVGAAGGSTIEGYAIRANSANPCADCHNLHSADLTVQEEWAKSGHAGKISVAKETAAKAQSVIWFNATYPTNTATSWSDSKTVGTSTRTVLEFFQRSAAGVEFYKTVGVTDTTGVAWSHYNWDDSTLKADGTPSTTNRATCQRCHTSTGVANFLADPVKYDPAKNDFSHLAGWATAKVSGQNELLYCWGCHSDSQTGVLRNPGALSLDYSAGANDTVVYADVAKSNVCVACHSGNGGSGDTIANSTADLANTAAIQPHYLAAAGTLMTGSINGGTGYEFAGRTYTKDGYHQNIGVNNVYNTGNDGPCVACHMSGAESHTFEVSAASTVCINCHAGLTDATIEEAKTRYTAALTALDNALKAKGIFFIPSYPYFVYDNGFGGGIAGNGTIETGEKDRSNGIKNWTTQVVGGNAKDTMGAAFNYNLLVHEPGAFAHNKAYAYQLIQDSIDYLADGKVDGLGVNAAVAAAAASKEFAESTTHPAAIETAASATSCADCHVPTSHYGGNAFLKAQYVGTSCADCHSDSVKTTAYQAILAQFAESAHGDAAGEAWIHYDWRSSNRSSCARCHTSTAFVAKLGNENDSTGVFLPNEVLKPAQPLTCSACHTNAGTGELRTPATEFTIAMRNGATVTYDVAGASALCTRCHSGRETGESIKADTDTTGVRVFVDSHYQPVAGTLYNKAGYEYAGQSYGDLGSHKLLGATSQGPCVSCHMQEKNHTFAAAACGSCHGVTAPVVDAANLKATYDAALNNLKLALEAKGIHYGPVHPFFYTAPYVAGSPNAPFTNWGGVYGTVSWKDTMGAAFNYNLLVNDKGAYAHNYQYAMKLIADSIDFMADGAVGQ